MRVQVPRVLQSCGAEGPLVRAERASPPSTPAARLAPQTVRGFERHHSPSTPAARLAPQTVRGSRTTPLLPPCLRRGSHRRRCEGLERHHSPSTPAARLAPQTVRGSRATPLPLHACGAARTADGARVSNDTTPPSTPAARLAPHTVDCVRRAHSILNQHMYRVRSVIGKRTRLLIEVVRVRFPPDLLLCPGDVVGHGSPRRGSRRASLRDRLAGRTLASDPRNAGSTPAPGTKATLTRRLLLSENLEHEGSTARERCTLRVTRRRAKSFQRSRMVRQPTVNRFTRRFDSFRWSE